MVLEFEEFNMLLESFKSSTITKLFRDGEFDKMENGELAALNQIEEKDILGVVDTEEDVPKLVNGFLGDKIETRYKRYYNGKIDDFEDDWDSPYYVNLTKDESTRWAIKLQSGRFLVLNVETEDIKNKLFGIRQDRRRAKAQPKDSEIMRKFKNRKLFLEENAEDFEKYKEFKKYFQEEGIWDELIDKFNEELDKVGGEYESDERNILDRFEHDGKWFKDEWEGMEFDFGDYNFDCFVTFIVQVEATWCKGFEGDYWSESWEDYYELDRVDLDIDEIQMVVKNKKTDEYVFEFKFSNAFDRQTQINFKSE